MRIRRVVCAALIAGMTVALAGCQVTAGREDAGTTGSTDTSEPTTTTVAPPTTAERAWVAGIAKLRRRLDRTILVGMTITHAKVDELYDTYRTCRPGVLKLEATPRLAEARQRALRACRDYEAAGRAYRKTHPFLDTPSERAEALLNEAGEYEGNGSNGLLEAASIAQEAWTP
jgi:hypothetical protein